MYETCTIILLPSANWYQKDTSRYIDVVLHTSHSVVCVFCRVYVRRKRMLARILHFITRYRARKESAVKRERCKKFAKRENVYNIVFIYRLVSFRFRRRQIAHTARANAHTKYDEGKDGGAPAPAIMAARRNFCFYFEISLLLFSFLYVI